MEWARRFGGYLVRGAGGTERRQVDMLQIYGRAEQRGPADGLNTEPARHREVAKCQLLKWVNFGVKGTSSGVPWGFVPVNRNHKI